jgi:hypothetical protein
LGRRWKWGGRFTIVNSKIQIFTLISETGAALSNQVQGLADGLTEESLNTIINSSETNQSKSDQLSMWIVNAKCVAKAWISDYSNRAADFGALHKLIGRAESKQKDIQNKVSSAQLRVAELDFAIEQPYVGSRDLNVFFRARRGSL